ncbi:MAG: VCBS repeat-containing protein [bacterium]|nr:MAG: VCBS repeat-containing protein [bacterium]
MERSHIYPRRRGRYAVVQASASRFCLTVTVLAFLVVIAASVPCQGQEPPFPVDPVWTSGTAAGAEYAALCDLDRDGDLDLIIATGGDLTLYRNNGRVFDLMPFWTSSPIDCLRFALGDVDRDGDLDIFTCGGLEGIRYNKLYLGDGGVFQEEPAWISESPDSTFGIAFADVNGDGHLDLVCGNLFQQNKLFLNNGDGTFPQQPAWSAGATMWTTAVALGDIDNDNDLDLVCGNLGQANELYLNDGDSLRTVPSWQSIPEEMTACLALGDINGDGLLDLVCGSYMEPNTVYMNIGGLFEETPSWTSQEADTTYSLELGDADGDGDLDLAVANEGPNRLYLNLGDSLQSAAAWSTAPSFQSEGMGFADVDGDGDLDLVFGNQEVSTLYTNNGYLFPAEPTWSAGLPSNQTMVVVLGDLNGDDAPDLVAGGGPNNAMYRNNGATFEDTPFWTSGDVSAGAALGDVDNDGDLDLLWGGSPGVSMQLYENDGGTFPSEPSWVSDFEGGESLVLDDINGDGYTDILCGDPNGNRLYLNKDGVFSEPPDWQSESLNTFSIALGDTDGDGDLDLACGNMGQNTLYLNGGEVFGGVPEWSSTPSSGTACVALGDIDYDGRLDLVCANMRAPSRLYLNDGGLFQSSPAWTSAYGGDYSISLGDLDNDGDLDMVCGNVRFYGVYLNDDGLFQMYQYWSVTKEYITYSMALGDVDADGDLDLVCGNDGHDNELFPGLRTPAYRGDLLAPTNQLPDNPAFLRFVKVRKVDMNTYRIWYTGFDVESDRAWIVPAYQFEGEPTWYPLEVLGSSIPVGPVGTSPVGVPDSLDCDVTLVPFDSRDVVLRLRVVSIPASVSLGQHVTSYHKRVGRIVPSRPAIEAAPDSLAFPTVNVGDTCSLEIEIENSGNLVLTATGVVLPSPEMRIGETIPLSVAPGEADTISVFLEPRTILSASGEMRIASNDPLRQEIAIPVTADIRALEIESMLLAQADELPLGEAVTVIVTPAPDVRVERGYLYHRPAADGVFADSVALTRLQDAFMVVIPGEAVTEAGLEYYIRVENSGVFTTDPPNAPDSVWYRPVVPPISVTATPIPNEGQDFITGRDVLVQVSLPVGAHFSAGDLHVRRGGTVGFETFDFGHGDPLPFATIPDTIVGARGIEYWAEIQTLTSTLSDPASDMITNPKTLQVTVEDLVEAREHPGGTYRMMSIPLDMEGTIEGALIDDLGPVDITLWRLFLYDSLDSAYVEVPNETVQSFEQGRAYWLISRDRHQIGTGPARGLSTPTGGPFALPLVPGYNMIGTPFAFPVAWDSVRVDTLGGPLLAMAEAVGTVLEPPVRWEKDGYLFGTDMLEPFVGYWVKNLRDTIIILSIPPDEAPQGQPEIASADHLSQMDDGLGEDEWMLTIQARTEGACDIENALGVRHRAVSTKDPLDRSEPPMSPGRSVSLYFPHGGWRRNPGRYAVDIRGGYGVLPRSLVEGIGREEDLWGHIWHFDVAKNFTVETAGDPVDLSFTGLERLPSHARIYLIDRHLGTVADLKEEGTYGFHLGSRTPVSFERETRFVLIVGSTEFIDENEDVFPTPPQRTALHQNYPNPFNPATIIRYDISHECTVELSIFDSRGALVRTLLGGHRRPGRYEVGWEGKNNYGRSVASGIYFYRLVTSTGVSETRKLIIMR